MFRDWQSAGLAFAGTITFTDLSGTVTVAGDNTAGLASGVVCSVAPSSCSVTLTPPPFLFGGIPGLNTDGYDIVQPGSDVVSDRLSLDLSTFTFLSGGAVGLGPPNGLRTIIMADDTVQTILTVNYFSNPAHPQDVLEHDLIRFQTVESGVPEPARGFLSLAGLAWLIFHFATRKASLPE